MIENIIAQKTDKVTGLSINDVTVALTNKKGISISNNPFLGSFTKRNPTGERKVILVHSKNMNAM